MCGGDDDDKLQSHAVRLRDDSMDHRPEASIDPGSDCSLTLAAGYFVQAVDALSDPLAIAGQRSTRNDGVRGDLGSWRESKTSSDVAHGGNCSSLSCLPTHQNCQNSDLAMPFEASPSACVYKEDGVVVMEVQCKYSTFDSGQRPTVFDHLDRVICDLAVDAGSAAVVVATGTDDVPVAADSVLAALDL